MLKVHGKRGRLEATTDQGSLCAERMGNGLFRSKCAGVATIELCEPIANVYERAIAAGNKILIFADASGLERYDESFRRYWSTWFRTHRKHVRRVHLLATSSVVTVGAAVTNLAEGNNLITSYRDQGVFKLAYQRAATRLHVEPEGVAKDQQGF